MTGLLVFIASASASAVMVFLMIRLAHSRAWYDGTGWRKVHSGNVPRLGGFGFVPAFAVAALAVVIVMNTGNFPKRLTAAIAVSCAVAFFGVWDDFRPLRPLVKMLLQTLMVALVVAADYSFRNVLFLGDGLLLSLPWLGHAIAFMWLLGMTNALNLIDGVDALAGGVSLIIALTFAYIFFQMNSGHSSSVMICLALAGAVTGFLVFNAPFPRARIFMGDGGSQFLGFILALLPMLNARHSGFSPPLAHIAAVFAIPILDTTAAVWRRVREGRPISSPDRAHIHHKLMNLGLSPRGVAGVLLGLQLVLSVSVAISFRLASMPSVLPSATLLAFAYVVAIGFFTVLHFMNRRRMAGTAEEERGAKADDATPPLFPTKR